MKNSAVIARHSSDQKRRFLDALDFDYVKIDERTTEDLLLFTYGLSKLIHFYNLHNQTDGDWSDFLDDEVVILARIADTEPNKIEDRFKIYLNKISRFRKIEKKRYYVQKCTEEIYQIAFLINSWLNKFRDIEQFVNIQLEARDEILNSITKDLSAALQKLKSICDTSANSQVIDFNLWLDFSVFDSSWELDQAAAYTFLGDTPQEQTEVLCYDLQNIFQVFYETLIYIKNRAKYFLSRSFQNDTHYPEVALLLAFLKLYQIPQNNINEISARYLDFYYYKVLRQKLKNPTHDKAYLSFLVNDNALFAHIQKGDRFIGGEYENGDNIIYVAEEYLQVNKASVKKVYTIFLESRSVNIRGRSKKLISNILSTTIPTEELYPNKLKPEKKPYPCFGESQSNKSAHEKNMSDAPLGFAIASPGLFLSEGKREITLYLRFAEESFKKFNLQLRDLSVVTGDPIQEVFIKCFLEAFKIHLTGAAGWLEVDKYVVVQGENNSLTIRFDVESKEPAIVSFSNQIHSGGFDTDLPLLKIILNSNSYIYAYSLLESLELEEITIDTQVSEIKDLLLYSDIGALSPNNPFYPFGSVPGVGSYLVIGKNEIFQKSIKELEINIEWFNLPKNKNGFQGYYEAYDIGLDNTSFEAKISILDGGRWKPEKYNDQQTIKLFRTVSYGTNGLENSPSYTNDHTDNLSPGGTLSNFTTIVIDKEALVKIKLPPNYADISKNISYSNTSQRGFLKLELSAPDIAFGNVIYPSVLSEIVIENTQSGLLENVRRGFAKKEAKKLPSPPYVPQIKSISLNYEASTTISLTDRSIKQNKSDKRGQFYHIYPFGDKLVYPDNSQQITPLIPTLNYEGALLLGFDGLNLPQTVSILFELVNGQASSTEEKKPLIEWSYLVKDEWKTFSESKIIKDETSGFIKTGIISIELPHDLTKGNTILDGNLYWLRVSAVKNIEATSKIASLCTQVLTVTLHNLDEKGEHLKKPLPAFTIDRPLDNIPGIQTVTQPLESFQGQPAETIQQFYVRTSERLRHKQRAVTPWDFEHLVLEKFPTIRKATCLPNMTGNKLYAPGNILIVVTPFNKPDEEDNLEPKANSEILIQIKEYLREFTSPLVNIEVRNPNYEKVRIICAVKLAHGYNYGFFVQKLNDDINKYLIGDMIKTTKTFELGGKINSSDVLSFMRTLPYVDFITKFSMVQIAKDIFNRYILLDTAREKDAKSFLEATKPWSALIPARKHQITILNEKEEIKSSQSGITDLELGNNFIIDE